MTIEVLPLGTRCSLACEFCYQKPIRDAGNQAGADYDMDAMKRALEVAGHHFTVFGGEPLLTPIEDLEELWRWGFERYGQNSVQTSATIVTEKHFELFKKYNVGVGISLEGPGELNDARWAGSLERTREASKAAEGVLLRLLEHGHAVSLITTLHRGNASADRLPRLLEWFAELDSRGLRNCNLHLMEVESAFVRERWALTEEENTAALIACAEMQSDCDRLRFQPITDMVALLLGDDRSTSCIWNACDSYTTRAVQGINGAGERVNCSRTNKNGVDAQKADRELLIRPIALFHVAQSEGGCSGCDFWYACKGSCPGEAVSGDWRRKTEHCKTLQLVFAKLEDRLAALGFRPVSSDQGRREKIEKALLEAYGRGEPMRIYQADGAGASSSPGLEHGDSPHGDSHGDSGAGHGDSPHGDSGHGDHGDTTNPVRTHGDQSGNRLQG